MAKKKLYSYTGAVSENLLVLNSADIKAVDVFSKIDLSPIPSDAAIKIIVFINKIRENQRENEITFTDDRLIAAYYKIMCKYPSNYGETKEDWFISYEYLTKYYDKGFTNIDNLIRFINLYLGQTFTSGIISDAELAEIKEVAVALSPFDYSSEKDLPSFIQTAFLQIAGEHIAATKRKEYVPTKQDVIDAIDGLKASFPYFKGKDKKDAKDSIDGLEAMLEYMEDAVVEEEKPKIEEVTEITELTPAVDGGGRKYQLGDMWSEDFDYDGMLEMAAGIPLSRGIEDLQKLYDSLEDVNYHELNEPLGDAIELLKEGKEVAAGEKLIELHNLALKEINELNDVGGEKFAKGGKVSEKQCSLKFK